jgi:hypothetical protein
MTKKLLLALLIPFIGIAQTQKQASEIQAKIRAGENERTIASPATQNIMVCNTVDIPYTQDFESAVVPAIPDCTTIENAGLGNNFETAANPGYGFGSTKVLRYSWNTANPANAWFYTAGLNLTAGTTYNISYRYGSAGSAAYTEKLKVHIGTAPAVASMSPTPLIDHPLVDNNVTPITDNLEYTPETTGVYYVGFNCYSNTDQFYLFVDDIAVTTNLGTAGFNTGNFSYYPNPVVDVLNLSYDKNIDSVTIYNLLGQAVIRTKVSAMNTQIDMRSLTKGSYFAEIRSGNAVEKVKVIKN